jgi:hypothetical protein
VIQNLNNEVALTRVGLLSHRKKKEVKLHSFLTSELAGGEFDSFTSQPLYHQGNNSGNK